jgi:N-acetyl-anhydromuramyl-L-alanine amidase AmpD
MIARIGMQKENQSTPSLFATRKISRNYLATIKRDAFNSFICGEVKRLFPDNETGWQAGNWEVNCRSVAICLDNDFENSRPSAEVIATIVKIIKENYNYVEKARIFGHREVNQKTTCPGFIFECLETRSPKSNLFGNERILASREERAARNFRQEIYL